MFTIYNCVLHFWTFGIPSRNHEKRPFRAPPVRETMHRGKDKPYAPFQTQKIRRMFALNSFILVKIHKQFANTCQNYFGHVLKI